MDNPRYAVVIHDCPEPCRSMEEAMANASLEFFDVKWGSEARELIAQYQPLLVFVDLAVWRRSHAEIVDLANLAAQPFNIIVVGSRPDVDLYPAVARQGAFEYVVPSFSREVLTRIVHAVAVDARYRREFLAEAPIPTMAS